MVNASSHGAVTLQSHEGMLFKVNGRRLKIFQEPISPREVVEELEFIQLP